MKTCPFCRETIPELEEQCPMCGRELPTRGLARGLELRRVVWRGLRAGGVVVLSVVLLALLVPGIRRNIGVVPARGPSCAERLQQIGRAIHSYHRLHGTFPPAFVTNAAGQPLYSWRVLILPFLDEATLYNRFRLDEPWNSPHNRALLQEMPSVYRCPVDTHAPKGHTSYFAVVCPDCIFREQTGPIEVKDGLSKTLMIGEAAGVFVAWTRPEDLLRDEHPDVGDQLGFSSRHADGAHFVFADGHVAFLLASETSRETFRELTTVAGGERGGFVEGDPPDGEQP